MKCDKCGKEIKDGEKFYTAIGINQCAECNEKDHGTVSLDFILDKIKNEKSSKS
jgi:hypothetical protein